LRNSQACSWNIFEWSPSVFIETFVNYEPVCLMSIKIYNLNSRAKEKKLKLSAYTPQILSKLKIIKKAKIFRVIVPLKLYWQIFSPSACGFSPLPPADYWPRQVCNIVSQGTTYI
jgi:hypothetical protein